MQDIFEFPPIDETLVKALEKLFPNTAPVLNWSEKEVWYKSGQASVVKFLKTKFDEQNETIIEDK
jgi:hypothetical protein